MSNEIIWNYFTPNELKCRCGKCNSTGHEMHREFMLTIARLRRLLGFPFIVTSAYRCPDHNENVASSGRTGAHTTGKALDIAVSGENAYNLLQLSLEYQITGIGLSQKGDLSSRFIHLDVCDDDDSIIRPRIWSY